MGNCFSDPSKPPGKGQKLGSAPQAQTTGQSTQKTTAAKTQRSSAPPRTLGGGTSNGDESEGAARDRALKAAEERAKAAQGKGVSGSNPKAGKLSAKLAAERKSPLNQQNENNNERMMDRGEWN